jgi:ketosteroid isomerase-like protein
MGRTGSLWAYEQTAVRPDVITTAKAFGGGLPIGACVTAPQHADVLAAGEHGSTFAGGPVVARAALAAFDVIDDPELLRRVRELGGRLASGLEEIGSITEVRQRGLMVGIDIEGNAPETNLRLLEAGLVANATGPHTIRFEPALIIGDIEVEEALSILGSALDGRPGAEPDIVALYRSGTEQWNAGDMAGLRDRYHPEIVVRHPDGWPEPGPSIGIEAVFRQFERLREDVVDRIEYWDVEAHGSTVVASIRWVGTGRESGAPTEMVMHQVSRYRGDRIAEMAFFWDREEAMRTARSTEPLVRR